MPCLPEHKVAPEWSALLEGAAGAITTRGDDAASGGSSGSKGVGTAAADTGAAAADAVSTAADAVSAGQAGSGGSGSTAPPADASATYDAIQEGGVTKFIITIQLFAAAGSTAADARAAAERLATAWQEPLLTSLRAAAAERQQQQQQQPDATATQQQQRQPTALSTGACAPALKPRGRRLTAAVCAGDLAAALGWLSARREAHWLEPTPRLARRDVWGDWVVQTGGRGGLVVAAGAATAAAPTSLAAQPYWFRGLDGSSQLLGISDSGVDTDSCYFFDPALPNVGAMLSPDPARRGAKLFQSSAHRKIASYYSYTDFGDADGHGTHVAGIAVGACYGSFKATGSGQTARPPPPSPPQPAAALVRGKRKKRPPPPPPPAPPQPSPSPAPSPPRPPPPPLSRPRLPPRPAPPRPSPTPPSTPSPPDPQRAAASAAPKPPSAPPPPTPGRPQPPPPPMPSPPPPPPLRPPPPSPAPPASGAGESTKDGSIAVQPQPSYLIDEATGMAPGARLAFYDIMDSTKTYRLPSYEDILQYQLDAGVFVQSDSWGSKQAFWYNSLCEQLDDFVWSHPQLLVVSAAGNDGELSPAPANGTVSAPANAKNTLAVGSTLSVDPADNSTGTLRLRLWTDSPDPPDTPPVAVTALTAAVAATAATSDAASGVKGRAAAAPPPPPTAGVRAAAAPAPPPLGFDLLVDLPDSTDFRTLLDLKGAVVEAVAATPPAACRKLTNGGAVAAAAGSGLPKMVVALRGGCMYYVKAMAAAAAGAAALAIVNDSPSDTSFLLQVNPTNVSLPAAPLPQAVGQRLLAALGAGVRVYGRATWHAHRPYDDVPSYSAYGPTVDGRIKPDLVAPGMSVLSAWSDGVARGVSDNCTARRLLSGTSMSAPLVAGAAVLARQYFMTGFYPHGRNDSPEAAPFTPSGVLLKAVLIGGAVDLQGQALGPATQLDPAPSPYQGFGRVDLSGSLPLSATAPSSWQLQQQQQQQQPGCASPSVQLVDWVPIREGEVHTYTLGASGDGPVVVTLAWPDPPADPLAVAALVNDLDLEVLLQPETTQAATATAATVAAAVVFRGNAGWVAGRANGSSAAAMAAAAAPDTRNNVERVSVPAGQAGALTVRVAGTAINSRYVTRFAADEQRYALVAHGCFSGLLVSEYNPDARARRPPPPSAAPST